MQAVGSLDIFGATAPAGASIPTHEIDELLLLSRLVSGSIRKRWSGRRKAS